MTFVPDDVQSQLKARGASACPYCGAWPSIPCVVHRTPCGCDKVCGDDGDADGPGTCKGLPTPRREPLVEIVLVPR